MKRNLQLAINGAMALASLTSTAALADVTAPADQRAAQLNQASLTSVEQSYLKIPKLCKAGNAAFEPAVVVGEIVSAPVLAIHAMLDGVAA